MNESLTHAEKVELAKDLVSHLRRVMRTNREAIPNSLRDQICGVVGHWLAHRLRGAPHIHPGNEKMGQWAGTKPRQTKKNVARLEEAGVLVRVAYKKGGRNATRFVVSLEMLRRFMIAAGVNVSPQLGTKLLDAENLWAPARPFATGREVKSHPRNGALAAAINGALSPQRNGALIQAGNGAENGALSAHGILTYIQRSELTPSLRQKSRLRRCRQTHPSACPRSGFGTPLQGRASGADNLDRSLPPQSSRQILRKEGV